MSSNLKILVAEDDDTSAKLISIILRGFAREIIRVKNGIEAIEASKSNPDVDLILMDIQMPLMNGDEATLAIREFNQKVIIIAQTANVMTDDKAKATSNGFNDYISKPINKVKIEAFILEYFS
ncbi:MAG: response regulator [Bacteroidales bacterium]